MTVCFLSAIFLILNAIIMVLLREPAMAFLMYVIAILTWLAGTAVGVFA